MATKVFAIFIFRLQVFQSTPGGRPHLSVSCFIGLFEDFAVLNDLVFDVDTTPNEFA